MSKINLDDTAGGYNLSVINANFQKIKNFLNDKVLMRDNTVGEPNSMANTLDMNGQRIINLPAPLTDGEPARKVDITTLALENIATVTSTSNGLMIASDKVKLDTISPGATANSPDVALLSRSNHIGVQDIATVTGLQTALDSKQPTLVSGTNIKTVNSTSILGSGNIVATSDITLNGVETPTNKTINLANNTLIATSAQLKAALTDETGSGSAVFATSPTLTTPVINGFTGDTSAINIGSGQLVKDTSGNVGIGRSPAYKFDVGQDVNFAASYGQARIGGSTAPNKALYLGYSTTGDYGAIQATEPGVSVRNLALQQFGGNVLIGTITDDAVNKLQVAGGISVVSPVGLGYGTGSGGTVTQPTDKTTQVVLNKPDGVITMAATALAAGAIVSFQLVNSVIAVSDGIVVSVVWGTGSKNPANYFVSAGPSASGGSALIALKNNTGGSLSEAVVITYQVVKGSAS